MGTERGIYMEANKLRHALDGFTGTVEYHRHFTGLQLTDGAFFLAENAGAHWLVDIVASYQPQAMRDPMLRNFQVWRLAVAKDRTAVVTCERDTDDVFLKREVPYTDFPLEEVTLYVQNGVLLLPSEY
jgi:hypothetical protein